MLDREKIIDILCERALIDIEDPIINDIWDELTELLSVDICDTIDFLSNCTKEEIYFISEIFEDIYMNSQSEKFIDSLYVLDKKFPELEIKKDIETIEKQYID